MSLYQDFCLTSLQYTIVQFYYFEILFRLLIIMSNVKKRRIEIWFYLQSIPFSKD